MTSHSNDSHPEWRSCVVGIDAAIADAIKNLNASGLQIVLVADGGGRLLGTITDGDVRRALLRGLTLEAPASEIMARTPLVVPPEMGRESALHLMGANKINQLPIVTSDKKIIGLHVWEQLVGPCGHDNTMIIMAGGFGKRLRPYTDTCPKPMLKVAGKPMLEHILLRAIEHGFGNFVISLHYLPTVITDYFGDGSEWGVRIGYVMEEEPLGTAGALSLLDPRPSGPFVVANGDIMTDINYSDLLDFHLKHKGVATMAVRQYEWRHPFGVVKTEGLQIIEVEEKPIQRTYVNAGIYVLSPAALRHLEVGTACDMPRLFEICRDAGDQAMAYPMHEPWLDVGRPEDYYDINRSDSKLTRGTNEK